MTFQAPIGSSLPRDRAKRLLAGIGGQISCAPLPGARGVEFQVLLPIADMINLVSK